jgi:hypothetical protein
MSANAVCFLGLLLDTASSHCVPLTLCSLLLEVPRDASISRAAGSHLTRSSSLHNISCVWSAAASHDVRRQNDSLTQRTSRVRIFPYDDRSQPTMAKATVLK